MKFSITVTQEPEYLLIKGVGYVRTLEDQKLWSDACYREVMANNASRVLIDERLLRFDNTIGDQLAVVQHYIDQYEIVIRSLRCAILVDQVNEELDNIWELVVNQRGFPWKLFSDHDAAVAFLMRD